MNRKDTYGIYNNTAEHISLLKYSKSSCGVDFLLNTAESTEKRGWFDTDKRYRTDFFEFYFFRKAEGHLFLAGERIELHPGMWLVISPFQLQEWHVELDKLDYTFLVFQEEYNPQNHRFGFSKRSVHFSGLGFKTKRPNFKKTQVPFKCFLSSV